MKYIVLYNYKEKEKRNITMKKFEAEFTIKETMTKEFSQFYHNQH